MVGATQRLTPALVFRVVVALSVLGSGELWRSAALVPAPGAAVHAPALAGWLLLVPRAPAFVLALTAIALAAAVVVLAGVAVRTGAAVLAAATLVVFGLEQLGGAPLHVHHVVWMAALLAATGRDASGIRGASFVLSLVYLFPGVHKLVDDGSPFFHGEALARLIRLKAFEAGAGVPFHLDQHPQLLVAGGALVIAAELAMPVLAVVRPSLAGAGALALHAVFWGLFHMPFTVLSLYAAVFFADAWARRAPSATRPPRAAVATAVVLAVGATAAGVAGAMQAWPFACYPTFATPVPTAIPDLRVDVERGGAWRPLTRAETAPLDVRTAVLSAARTVRTPGDAARFLAWRRRDPRFAALLDGAERVRVVRVVVDLTGAPRVLDERVLLDEPAG